MSGSLRGIFGTAFLFALVVEVLIVGVSVLAVVSALVLAACATLGVALGRRARR